jgi:hypothetical protein
VTNWHVALRDQPSVVRINKKDGGVEIFETEPTQWEFEPHSNDLAVLDLQHLPLRQEIHEIVGLPSKLLLEEIDIPKLGIGPGEDVFMIGRFVDHDGAEKNVPAARFGNINVMPQSVQQETGATDCLSFILDMHSRTGYSGSPVFVYRTFGSDLTGPPVSAGSHFIKLLGIHWGQYKERWKIEPGTTLSHSATLMRDDSYVSGLSGMTLAIPAWEITRLLNMEKCPVLPAVRVRPREAGTGGHHRLPDPRNPFRPPEFQCRYHPGRATVSPDIG